MNALASAARPAPPRLRLQATLVTPVAPLAGLWLAYLVCHPRRPKLRRQPAKFGLDPAELRVPAPSESRSLHGWLCPGDPRRVVLVGHGLGQDKSYSLGHARFLNRAGYTVVLFDFRNHGASFTDRGLTRFSERFADDVVAVAEQVRAMPPHADARIAVYGISMSSFAVMHALPRLGQVDAVVCDSGPAPDPVATMRNLMRAGLLPLPRPLVTQPALAVLEAVSRPLIAAAISPPRAWPPPSTAPGCGSTSMLFLVGDRDKVVSVDEVRALASSYPRAKVVVVPEAGHMRTISAGPKQYRAAVLDFLGAALGTPGQEARCASA
jgi:pimeloyl-ACP methyl ester carboxylesterase